MNVLRSVHSGKSQLQSLQLNEQALAADNVAIQLQCKQLQQELVEMQGVVQPYTVNLSSSRRLSN